MNTQKSPLVTIAGIILALFTLVTLFMTISIFFDLFEIREKEGNYVLFIVVANFIAGLLYIPAVYGYFKNKKWTSGLLLYAAVILIIAFIGLMAHIVMGGIYEKKTIFAMLFRIFVTVGFALIAKKYIGKSGKPVK